MERTLTYLGKAQPQNALGPASHPLAFHCLDVAVVALAWLDASPVLRRVSLDACRLHGECYPQLRAWIGFFAALHDIGKFHALFQCVLRQALGDLPSKDIALDTRAAGRYFHGPEGYSLFYREYADWLATDDEDLEFFNAWSPWIQSVTGHHGELPIDVEERGRYGSDAVMVQDREARKVWVKTLEGLLLCPVGLSLRELPPVCGDAASTWFAGLCSVSDWVGSNTDIFPYALPDQSVEEYFGRQSERLRVSGALADFGLVASAKAYSGLGTLLGESESPRGVQTLVADLPLRAGLTLIEAPTGSGKTEAALAYAWRLIDAGFAESIVFALPTQATANGMLPRAEAFADKAFGSANVVLAHGKRDWTEGFIRLLEAAHPTAQGREEAGVQCAAWLGQSRKRVFLGQVGVCTIDQALLAVLPVRHKFVRGFGLQRSVLIVDEVHAYDSYMHGLLGELLKQQCAVGGSVVLLSATLPSVLRGNLLAAWGVGARGEAAPYPVVWHAAGGDVVSFEVAPANRPQPRVVAVEHLRLPGAIADEALLSRLMAAARAGACVGVVLNRVDDAQHLARCLRAIGDVPVDVFHSRYRYCDRMEKEHVVLADYGRKRATGGRILVATQVIEQSLDLDFDWLVTQICPVDLLFQRLGRLHRHDRTRPPGFEKPHCTVLSVDGEDYGSHALIYGNTRVLWRTDCLLRDAAEIVFPEAYREWIERVYVREDWDEEPELVCVEFDKFRCMEIQAQREAIALTRTTMTQFRDEESHVLSLTRGNEMGLTVLPQTADGLSLDGESWAKLDEREQAEAASLNGIPVPSTRRWKGALAGLADEEGRYRLVMTGDGNQAWAGGNAKAYFRYSKEFGLSIEGDGDESA